MWGLYELLALSAGCLVWGVLIAVLCVVLFFVLIKGWYRSAVYTPVSYMVGLVLCLFLAFQCTLIVGGLKIGDLSEQYKEQVEQLVENFYEPWEDVSTQESSEIVSQLVAQNPILQYYVEGGEFTGYSAVQLPQVLVNTLKQFIGWYIVRRLLWCLLFVLVGAFVVIKSMDVTRESYRGRRAVPGGLGRSFSVRPYRSHMAGRRGKTGF